MHRHASWLAAVVIAASLPLAAQEARGTLLGRVTEDGRVRVRGTSGAEVINSAGEELKTAWKRPLAWD